MIVDCDSELLNNQVSLEDDQVLSETLDNSAFQRLYYHHIYDLFCSSNSPLKKERQNYTYLDTSPPYELNKAVGMTINTSIDSIQHTDSIDVSIVAPTTQFFDLEKAE